MSEHNPASSDAFYGSQYTRIYGQLASEIRREAFGEDFGQESWRGPAEQAEIAALLRLGPDACVLDVACGAGGPSLALVEQTGCRLLGIDIVPEGVSSATAEAVKRGLTDRAKFVVLDGGEPLPFEDGTFDAIVCIDSISHLPDRHSALRDWARLLKAGGRLVFTDPLVVTGALSKLEIDGRCALVLDASNAFFVPPGFNESAMTAAGLVLLQTVDRAAAAAEIAGRWRDARERRANALIREEGEDWFRRRQVMLNMTAHLASERRLTRFFYLAEKREESQ
ncbi:methyltransferase domain-containing protein [Rhizobium sp. CB3171]|uniref:class I SAM-dependent methyltransferase n=1 Tax=Rhizobium sp. CB3171 TaxID=3039157 RepID=UPI0024B0ADF0|nr:class I SAM-dependent methyltransferase [Rhizobium sp. CB3171]WFU02340.1 methyltransferase domain-containing protein [Rhizobium sp. CB3171]